MVTVRARHQVGKRWIAVEIAVSGNPQVSATRAGLDVGVSPRVSPVRPRSQGPVGHDGDVATGKRAGARRSSAAPRRLNPATLGLGAAITLCVVAWGYLVYAAIDFGTAARGGASSSWGFMALASLGAVACLFVGLMLIARLMRVLGVSSSPDGAPAGPRPQGGKRAAR